MIRLIYISEAATPFTEKELLALLQECRQNNGAKHITGMLIYDGSYFIQVLEGEETDVSSVYRDILSDERNRNNYVVEKSEITRRSFPTWTMGFRNLSEADPNTLPDYSDFFREHISSEEMERKINNILRLVFSFQKPSGP